MKGTLVTPLAEVTPATLLKKVTTLVILLTKVTISAARNTRY